MNVRHLEPLGFIKFDILGLETLKTFEDTIIRILKKDGVREPTFEQCRQWYMDNLHPSVLDMNDPQVYEEVFHAGKYAGMFQFMNTGMQRLGSSAKVSSIEEIATVSAYLPSWSFICRTLTRCMSKQKMAQRMLNMIILFIEEVLGKTFGLIVFQEDIMNLVNTLGDKITMSDANVLRKLLTKKGLSETKMKKKKDLYERFLKGCEKKGMSFADAKCFGVRWNTSLAMVSRRTTPSLTASSLISVHGCRLTIKTNGSLLSLIMNLTLAKRQLSTLLVLLAMRLLIGHQHIRHSMGSARWKTCSSSHNHQRSWCCSHRRESFKASIFVPVEDLLFDKGVIARKVNKKSLDAMCRAGAMESLQDDRFFGDKHFWSAVVVDKPKNKKKLDENIEKYKDEGTFTKSERISHLQALTGIYPINMVVPVKAYKFFEMQGINPLSEYDQQLGKGWCIPTEVTTRKTKGGKPYYQVTVIDSNMKTQKINCWGVNH